MDVQTALLNGNREEHVHTKQAQGFEKMGAPALETIGERTNGALVMKLSTSLY